MNGGYGDDFISGHEGIDTVTLRGQRFAPVTVSLDNAYNDGSAGEGDNVLDDTEIVIGSAFGRHDHRQPVRQQAGRRYRHRHR